MSHITMFDTVAPGHIIKESQFDEASHHCPSPTCSGGLWNVQCLSAADQLWRVSSETGGSYLVAGVTPACPWCGAELLVTSEPQTQQFTNGLRQPMGGLRQPRRVENDPQWN